MEMFVRKNDFVNQELDRAFNLSQGYDSLPQGFALDLVQLNSKVPNFANFCGLIGFRTLRKGLNRNSLNTFKGNNVFMYRGFNIQNKRTGY